MERAKCPKIEDLAKITPEQAIEYVRYVADIRDKQRRWFTQHDYNALAVARKKGIEYIKEHGYFD